MSILTRIAAAVALAGSFALAAPAAEAQQVVNSQIFPLRVGNKWSYNRTMAGPLTVSVDAIWTSPIDGITWRRIRQWNGNYHWVRLNAQNRVYEWPNKIVYRLGAGPGYPWPMDLAQNGGEIPCSTAATMCEVFTRNATVTVPAGTFSGCIGVRFRGHCADAGLSEEYYARGVGLVKRVEQSFTGPRTTELVSATIDGKKIGVSATVNPPMRVVAEMAQPDYYENHMPGPGPRPTQGPEITFRAIVHPTISQDATLNFPDLNVWQLQVVNPDGAVVWQNNRLMAPAPVGGVNVVIPVAGRVDAFKFRFPFGSKAGTYRVKVKLLANGNYPQVETTFSYGWAM